MTNWLTGRRLAALLFVVSVLLAVGLIKPAVPNEIRLFTGPDGSTFHQYGLRYKEILERDGITVRVEETRGSLENLTRLLEEEAVSAAIVDAVQIDQSTRSGVPTGVSSLGTLSLEPIWVFGQRDAGIDGLGDLRGHRVAPGWQGSGARVLTLLLLEATGIDDRVEVAPGRDVVPEDMPAMMQANRIGALIASGQPDSRMIDTLLRSPELEVLAIPRAEAITLKYPFLEQVRLPEGAHDLESNIPERDLTLLAAGTELLVSDPLSPGLADLLLEAANEIHGEATLFSEPGRFPSSDVASIPLSVAARHYYADGPSALQEYLPFRLATLVDRFLLVAVAIASSAVAIFGILPRLLSVPFNMTVGRVYRRIAAIERSLSSVPDREALLAELDELDRVTADMRVPMRSLVPPWFELRQNLHDLRDRLESDSTRLQET